MQHDEFDPEFALLGDNPTEDNLKAVQTSQQKESNRKYSASFKSYLLAGFLTSFAYLIYITLKLESDLPDSAYWSYSNIFLLIAIAIFTEATLKYVRNPHRPIKNLARIMLLSLVYSSTVLSFLFNLLVCLQADGFIKIRYILIFLPPAILSAVIFHFIRFLMPGFLDTENRFYKEATLMIAYYVAGILTLILVSFQLDGMIAWQYTAIFTPLFFAIAVHVSFLLMQFTNKVGKFEAKETAVLLLATTFLILMTINLQNKENNRSTFSWFAVLSPIYLLLLAGVFKSAYSLLRKRRAN